MRNTIEFDLPLKEKSIITFVINNNVYKCRPINVGGYYVSLINDEFLENGIEKKDLFHDKFVQLIFDETLGKPPKKYYEEIFPDQSFSGCWPESTLKELEKVLLKMREDFDKKEYKPTLDKIEHKPITKQLKTKENGNEIKLPRTKSIISRGTVPTGYRIRSKVHKTAISIQPLSHTKITR